MNVERHAYRRRGIVALAGSGVTGLSLLLGTISGTVAQGPTPRVLAAPVAVAPSTTTIERPYLVAADPARTEITPLLTAGEMVGDYMMAGLPDGLGAYQDGEDVVLFMNHELTPEENENLSYARVSRLVLDGKTGAVKSGSYALNGTEEYERLCSASLAGPEVGFTNPVFLTGEESTSGPKGGLALAIDGKTAQVTELPWLGHIAHENQIVVPGFAGKTIVIGTDDDSNGSELYMYVADSPEDMLSGKGELYVFKADSAAGTGDIQKGQELSGAFVPVDQANNADAKTLQDFVWSAGAFKFVRLEDVTYDRTNTTTIYFDDTGDDKEPNLAADGSPLTKNGRLYAMTLDPNDPTKVTGFKVLLDGDAGDDMLNPDNIDASETTIMIQEDLNGYNRAENSENTGRILAYDIASGAVTVVAMIDQSAGEGMVDAGDEGGSWESSGIINVSDVYGPGTWLVDIQAHSIKVPQFGGEDEGGQLLMLRQK